MVGISDSRDWVVRISSEGSGWEGFGHQHRS